MTALYVLGGLIVLLIAFRLMLGMVNYFVNELEK